MEGVSTLPKTAGAILSERLLEASIVPFGLILIRYVPLLRSEMDDVPLATAV